jgi:hypothetical protein
MIGKLVAKTERDGTYYSAPVFLDYRTNTCNLKCRTCGPTSSSTWEKHLSQAGKQLGVKFSRTPPGRNQKTLAEFEKLSSTPRVRQIYFAGGEPTMNPGHLKFLESMIERKQHRVLINYNTNLTMSEDFLLRWLRNLRPFKNVTLGISVDGAGRLGEYIRSGLSWDDFNRRLDLLIARFPKRWFPRRNTVFLDPTLTSLLLFNLKSFSDFALEKRLKVMPKLMIHSEDTGAAFRVEFLPLAIRQKQRQLWKEFLKSLPLRDRWHLRPLDACLDIAWAATEWDRPAQLRAVAQVLRMDRSHSNGQFREFLNGDEDALRWFDGLIAELSKREVDQSSLGRL